MGVLEEIRPGDATTDDALGLFDSLEPVDVEFMLGSWVGEGYHTGHTMDGLLEAYHWHGKHFDSAEAVHPLIFRTRGDKRVPINPGLLAPGMPLLDHVALPRSGAARQLFQLMLPLLKTRKPRARLRMMKYRGKTSATMIYDQLPIHDVFRRLDKDTVLGLMDMRNLDKPFFFLLRREGL